MASPEKPVIDFSYQYLPYGSQLDNDLAELVRGVDDTIDALADVRRSDGALPNGKVTPDSLSEATRDLMAAVGPPGPTGPTGPSGATVLDLQFATKATAEAFSPVAAPDYIRTAFYDTNQVAGSGGVYRKTGTPAGDLVITLSDHVTLVGYTLSDTPTASQKGARKNNVADDAPAVQAAHNLGIGGVDLPAGTYRLVPGAVSSFTLGNTAFNARWP